MIPMARSVRFGRCGHPVALRGVSRLCALPVAERERERGWEAIRLLSIKAASPEILVKELSGGNAQKVTIAKWLRLCDADPQRAATFWTSIASAPDRRWTRARTTDSTRHWFEVDHTLYLRALQRVLDELESAR